MISLVTNKKTQHGMTLLEIMLVLAIASSIIVLSIRSYRQYQQRAYIEQIKYNVDTLFQAMKNYYHAECASGTLATASTNQSYGVPLSALSSYLPTNWQVPNPDITSYVLQFNPYVKTGVTVNACVVTTPGTPCILSSSTLPPSQAQVITWVAQIAVKFVDSETTADVNSYKASLGANCLSDISGTIVTPCATAPVSAGNKYLVWERLPSAMVSNSQSKLWQMTPLLKQFNLQYTHDQMLELNEGYATRQNYLCGG